MTVEKRLYLFEPFGRLLLKEQWQRSAVKGFENGSVSQPLSCLFHSLGVGTFVGRLLQTFVYAFGAQVPLATSATVLLGSASFYIETTFRIKFVPDDVAKKLWFYGV